MQNAHGYLGPMREFVCETAHENATKTYECWEKTVGTMYEVTKLSAQMHVHQLHLLRENVTLFGYVCKQ